MKLLIFSTHEMKYFWYLPKKVNFPFIFSVKGKPQLFSLSFLVNFALLSAFNGYNNGWKHNLHLENGL